MLLRFCSCSSCSVLHTLHYCTAEHAHGQHPAAVTTREGTAPPPLLPCSADSALNKGREGNHHRSCSACCVLHQIQNPNLNPTMGLKRKSRSIAFLNRH
uniref:Uncharacterized protein n=1 Tax=Aegilops tauschii subsp. strangulata TaxID=200361 RepID=A0A453MNQ7_AEGTS